MANSYIIEWQKRNPEKVARTKRKYYVKVGGTIKQSLRERYKNDGLYQLHKQTEALENYYWKKQHPFEVQCRIFGKIKI